MMRLLIYITLLLCAGTPTWGQDSFSIVPVADLDGKGFMAGMRADGLIMHAVSPVQRLVSDEGLPTHNDYATSIWCRGDTWSSYPIEGLLLSAPSRADASIGTLHSAGDSVVVFSLDRDYLQLKSGSIVMARISSELLDRIELVLAASEGVRHLHPCLSDDGLQLVFSSNMAGGVGGFDLYYINRLASGEGWSRPISLGPSVNTPKNEVFPTWKGSTVFFSSDGHPGAGGLDVYTVSRETQWQEVSALPKPFNSSGDDFMALWLGNDDCFINSDRSGADRVYRLTRDRLNPLAKGLRAELICAGTPVQGVTVYISNTLNERILTNTTNEHGGFDVGTLELKRTYKAHFEGAPQAVLDKSLLYIINEEGKRIMVFAPNRNGAFMFELMPFSELDDLPFAENPDESRLLSVAVEGQLYETTPGDVGSGEVIYIERTDGQLVALTYTTEGGQFRFDELSPELQYTFRFDEDRQSMKMIIIDRGEEVVLDVHNGRVTYTRVRDDEAITLNNERGERIVIRRDELFVIRNIYYAFASHDLNADAQAELNSLVMILRNNPELKLALGSHTDSRGSHEFNMELSQKRAASCVAYLGKLGISTSRLSSRGYGETQLLNHCDDQTPCEEEEHAVNRRTEIRLSQ